MIGQELALALASLALIAALAVGGAGPTVGELLFEPQALEMAGPVTGGGSGGG